ncbi:hypothetical protein GCM10023194_54650 [Planotetraspora phitsanulokensis]|uniref:Uncharacterized protein n=1 Tax=Planotetraspora phitsanulokensis TaxID=575192 RepID=A0A8J3XJ85_9ACTN|nr:hypothetical protein Pph01_67390 [Planotetraspora phitsanulokensis]
MRGASRPPRRYRKPPGAAPSCRYHTASVLVIARISLCKLCAARSAQRAAACLAAPGGESRFTGPGRWPLHWSRARLGSFFAAPRVRDLAWVHLERYRPW